MKIKLTSFYGARNPGDIVDCDAKEAERLISVGGAVEYAPTDEEPSAAAASKKPLK